MKKINKNGFTLFELLVSISIIAIMTALASVAFSGAQKKARDARRVQDIKLVQTAAEQYYSQNNYTYPPNSTTPWIGNSQNILDVFPTDPKNDAVTGFVYSYTIPVAGSYCVCARMENSMNANSVDGNSVDATKCQIVAPNSNGSIGPTTKYFCAKNQQ